MPEPVSQSYIASGTEPRFVTWAEMCEYLESELGGGAGGGLQKAEVSITHSQILNLYSLTNSNGLGVQIIPAQGAGKYILVQLVLWATSTPWTPYTGLDIGGGAVLVLAFQDWASEACGWVDANLLLASYSPVSFICGPPLQVSGTRLVSAAAQAKSTTVNKAVGAQLANSANPGGGATGNTLKVIAYYTVENI